MSKNNKITIINSSNIHIKNSAVDDSTTSYRCNGGGLNVVIVDDDKNSGESLKDVIKYRGHNVTLIDEGMKFINRISNNSEKIDIIFMDYHTNEIDVCEVNFSDSISDKNIQRSHNKSKTDNRIIRLDGDYDSDNTSNSDSLSMDINSDIESINSDVDEVTGTYVTRLARSCFDLNVPIFGYTGDNSTEAIADFKASKFKGVFVKPVSISLINNFFEIMENEYAMNNNSLKEFSQSTILKIKKLSMKNKNLIFFKESTKAEKNKK